MRGEVDIFLFPVLHWAWPIVHCISPATTLLHVLYFFHLWSWQGGLQLHSFHNWCHLGQLWWMNTCVGQSSPHKKLLPNLSCNQTPHTYSSCHSARFSFPPIWFQAPRIDFPTIPHPIFPIFLAFSPLQACLWLCSLGAILAAWSGWWLSSIWAQITPHHSTYARPPLPCYALLCLCTGGSACIYRSIGWRWRNGAPQLLILCPKRDANKFSDDIDIPAHHIQILIVHDDNIQDKIGPQNWQIMWRGRKWAPFKGLSWVRVCKRWREG